MLRNGKHDLLAAMQQGDERQERILGQRTQLRRDVDPVRFQEPFALAEGALANRVEDHIVFLLVPGEIPGRLVDDFVGAQALDQLHVAGVAAPVTVAPRLFNSWTAAEPIAPVAP